MTQNHVSILNKQMVDVLSMSDQVKDKTYMQLVSSAPDNDHKTIEQILTNLIHSAKKSIYIVTPYLVPTRIIIESLIIKMAFPQLKNNIPLIFNLIKNYLLKILIY